MLENGGLSGPESKQSLVSVQSTNLNFNLNSVTPSDKVTIQNLNKTRIAWKLQTTSPTRYYISPSCGFLTPQETVVVTVTLLNAKKFNDRQRFLITAAVAPESSKNRKEFWAHPIDFSHLHCIRILAESGDAKAPPDANAVAGSAPPSDPVATARSPTIITESNEQKTADAPKEDTTQLVTEIHGMVETKSTTTRKMLEAVNSVKKIEMELDKIAVVTKKEKYMLNQAVTTLEAKRSRMAIIQEHLRAARDRGAGKGALGTN